jgi:hypothetical protein
VAAAALLPLLIGIGQAFQDKIFVIFSLVAQSTIRKSMVVKVNLFVEKHGNHRIT